MFRGTDNVLGNIPIYFHIQTQRENIWEYPLKYYYVMP